MFLPSLHSLKLRAGSHEINPCIITTWIEYRKKDHILKPKTCAGIPVRNDIYLTLFLMLWVAGKGLDEKKGHSGVPGYMLWNYSWAFGAWVRFLCNFPKTGKLQGTPELWIQPQRSPSRGSLYVSTFISCFTVYFMSLVVLNCWYLLGVLQMKNWWWGQQRLNLYWRCGNEHREQTDRGLGCNTWWSMRRGKTSGGKQGEGEWWQSYITVFSLRNKIS